MSANSSMSNAEYALKVAQTGATCPHCRSDDVEGMEFNVSADEATQEMACSSCGYEWNDIYKLTGYRA